LSKIPLLSFLLTFPVFGYIFTFFYVKKQKQADIFRILFCCLSALFIFEGVWSGMQFIGRSPLGKPIESIIDESTNKDWAHTAVEDYTYFRAQGTFSHPNYLGIFIAAFMPLVIYPALVAKWPTGLVFASVTGFSAGLIALIVSGSRTSWIGLAISVAAEIWFLKQNILFKPNAFFLRIVRYSVILFLLILPVLIIPRLSQFSTTVLSGGGVDFRISLLKNSLTMISNNPLGVGLGMYPYILFHEIGGFTSYPTEPHNLLTQISVSGGLIAGISFILLIYISIRKYLTKQFFKNIRITENYILIISLSAFLFISGFYPVLTEQPVIGFFWIILGAVDS
jgi:O-antigen ligase